MKIVEKGGQRYYAENRGGHEVRYPIDDSKRKLKQNPEWVTRAEVEQMISKAMQDIMQLIKP